MRSKTVVILGVAIALLLLILGIQGELLLHDGKLHVVFCDVGQGDGIIIKSPQGKILLFDGGPDDTFANCVAHFLPFWQRSIDLMMVSHPHSDHFIGDVAVLEKYQVKAFAKENVSSDQKAYQLLQHELADKHIPQKILSAGDQLTIGSVELAVAGPSQELVARSSPHGVIGESKEFGSLLMRLQFGKFSLLLPGDSQAPEIHEGIDQFGLSGVTVLQTPHHGSGTGLDQAIMATLQPQLAIISVGANNRYHLPSPVTTDLLTTNHIPSKRTDQNGAIEIITDGKTYRVKTER